MAKKQAAKAEKCAETATEPQAFAVVRTCGKQYRVTAGTLISIDTQDGKPDRKSTRLNSSH